MQNSKFEKGRENNICFILFPGNFKFCRFSRCSGAKTLETSRSKYVLEGSKVVLCDSIMLC